MPNLRPMNHRDLGRLKCRTFEEQDLVDLMKDIEPGQQERYYLTAARCRAMGPAVSYIEDQEVICSFGVTIIWKGVGEIWLATSPLWIKYALPAVIWVEDWLDWLQDENDLARLQADVLAENEMGRRFIEHYGFVAEGVMRSYDEQGRDMVRYARIREEDHGK